jgi:hypothetical protein
MPIIQTLRRYAAGVRAGPNPTAENDTPLKRWPFVEVQVGFLALTAGYASVRQNFIAIIADDYELVRKNAPVFFVKVA